MIRDGATYRQSIQDGRAIWINGTRVDDPCEHPQLQPIIDVRAHIYDMQHAPETQEAMTHEVAGERVAVGLSLPYQRQHWQDKRAAVDLVMHAVGGVVTRVGDETIGEMWSLWDGKDILNEIDPRFAQNIERHIHQAIKDDPFHVSANTDPKGDRSKAPKDQDPDILVHVVKETDAGIIIRGAKYETAASYSNQAFLKPTIANWGDSALSDYALVAFLRWAPLGLNIFAEPILPTAQLPTTTPYPTVSTKLIPCPSSIMCWYHGKTSCFIDIPMRPVSFEPPCTVIQHSYSSSEPCLMPI